MKLRTKFFLIFSTLAVIPLLIITIFSYQHYINTTYDRMNEFSDNLFHNAVSEANTSLSSLSQAVNFLTFYGNEGDDSIISTLKKFSSEDKSYTAYDVWAASHYCDSIFQNLMVSNENIQGIYIFTPTNEIFSNSDLRSSVLRTGYDPRQKKWYNDTIDLNGKYYISTITSYDMFTDSSDSIYLARSIEDIYTHRFLGVILIDCKPEILNLDNVNSMPDFTLITISNKKTGVTLYSNIDRLNKDFAKSTQKILTEQLVLSPLELTAVFDYSALYREFNMTTVLLITIAVICGVGVIILAYLVSTNLVSPIEHLSRKMSEQHSSHLSFSSKFLNRTDEIGTLYNEYNSMVDELNASIKKDYEDKLISLDAQMRSLEAQINSHFLFNTLESINSLAELDDDERISTMVQALGNMFRYSIKTQSELVSVSDELKHVSDYVSIQQIRFNNKFTLKVDIPEYMLGLKVLKLILQPLVENALYHGLNYCTTGDQITIIGTVDESYLYLTVSDNGVGMSPEDLSQLQNKMMESSSFTELGHRTKQSIGLKNIHTRIELYYGKGYGLTISSRKNEGTSIQITLPRLS